MEERKKKIIAEWESEGTELALRDALETLCKLERESQQKGFFVGMEERAEVKQAIVRMFRSKKR